MGKKKDKLKGGKAAMVAAVGQIRKKLGMKASKKLAATNIKSANKNAAGSDNEEESEKEKAANTSKKGIQALVADMKSSNKEAVQTAAKVDSMAPGEVPKKGIQALVADTKSSNKEAVQTAAKVDSMAPGEVPKKGIQALVADTKSSN